MDVIGLVIDVNSLLKPLGYMAATVGVLSIYTNLVSYYGTKIKLNRLASKYGDEYAKEVMDREYEAHSPKWTNLVGGFGIKLLKKKYVF